VKKLDVKLREAAEAMQSHMTNYKEECEAGWRHEVNKRLLHEKMDTQGREVANTIAKRIRSRISTAFIGVEVRCSSSVDHRDYTVKPFLNIKITGQCRRISGLGKLEAFGSFEAEWRLSDPSIYKIEEAIDMAVTTARLIAGQHHQECT